MYSKQGYKFFICSVTLGQFSLSKITSKGSSIIFPKNFRRNLKYYKRKSFSDSSLYCIFKSKNFRFPFSKKNNLT